eukprot:s11044_g1.t1
MAMTANSTVSSLISKARERASAPGLTVASLHGSPDVELPHAATLGAVLPQGELRLLLRETEDGDGIARIAVGLCGSCIPEPPEPPLELASSSGQGVDAVDEADEAGHHEGEEWAMKAMK